MQNDSGHQQKALISNFVIVQETLAKLQCILIM